MMKRLSTAFITLAAVLAAVGLVSMVTTASAQDPLFAPAVNYGVGIGPYSVFSTDLHGNNDNDLTVANYGSNNVSIYLNLSDGLVGYWSFDDGTATDNSGNGNNGTIYEARPVLIY
jgi:hypothetical protein